MRPWIYAWSSLLFRHHHSTARPTVSPPGRRERGGKKRLRGDGKMMPSLSWCSAQTGLDHLSADDHAKDDPEKKSVFQSDERRPWLGVYPSRVFGKQRNHKPEQTQCGRCDQGRAHTSHQSISDDADFLGRAQGQSLKHKQYWRWPSPASSASVQKVHFRNPLCFPCVPLCPLW